MTTAELADQIAKASGISKADARQIIDGVLDGIANAAQAGEEVALNGFGKFKVKSTAAREGRNPGTGETIQIKAARKLTFTPAKVLKDRLNG